MPFDQENLGDGLILRSVRDERDAARFIALNERVTGEGAICERLLDHHPETGYDNYLIVEDRNTGQVVSTTCLIPWRCWYDGVVLETAMLEMVVTHPAYRHRGLVRAQVKRFHQVVSERGLDLCIIQGIPYYYRQYGYAYALDHAPWDLLPARCVPDAAADAANRCRIRPATPDDAEMLAGLYGEALARCQVGVLRAPAYWRYLLERVPYPVQVVEDGRTGAAAGYVCAHWQANGRHARVVESGMASCHVALAALRQLKAEGAYEIGLGGSPADTLVRLGRSLGSVPQQTGQWLLRIPDVARFLARIGPVLERRLAGSDCAGLTANLCLNLFRQAFVLRFQEGQLAQVEGIGFVDTSMNAGQDDARCPGIGRCFGIACIPPDAFVRLALGYRSLDELWDAWPDIAVKAEIRHLLEVLFPRLTSWINMPY